LTGIGSTVDTNGPSSPVLNVNDAIHLAMGMNTACVVRAGGTVSCWGYWNGGWTKPANAGSDAGGFTPGSEREPSFQRREPGRPWSLVAWLTGWRRKTAGSPSMLPALA
jgi:hypothetical protein